MKSRFCPSPTGYMHLGNARTALFNALLAKQAKGSFLLRIEDTDKARSSEDHTAALQEDLLWLGLAWQEGPGVGGPQGPYWQSQRQAIYDKYYQRLAAENLVYSCFCSDEELAITRKVQLASGQPPRYPGTCSFLTAEAVAEKQAQGLQATLRFKVPKNQTIEFTDLVRGIQRFNSDHIGDFIIRRADGTASFIFCNAIDDALMGVTHALRGEDHLTNTPRQILVLQALQLPAPNYGHISMIVGKDGSPLSKRHGSRSIKELREEGYLAMAVVNYLARLGHYYESPVYMEMVTLAENFAITTLGSAPAKFDSDQLLYWQKEAINAADETVLWQWMGAEVHKLVPEDKRNLFITTVRPNCIFPKDAEHWAKVFFATEFAYSDEAQQLLRQATADLFSAAIQGFSQYGASFKTLSNFLQEKTGIKGKALFQPLRVALTGELNGPTMDQVFQILGSTNVKARLQQAENLRN